MRESTRRLFLWTAAVVCAVSIVSIYQIAARSITCGDLICQLRYAASYAAISDLPLGAIVLLGAVLLFIVLTVLQLSPKRLGTIGRFCTLGVCIGGLVLTLRIAAIETFLLHGWSWSCVVASWLSSLLLCTGVFMAATDGYPKTRFQGGSAAVGAVLVAGLSWHLMQTGGIHRVRKQSDQDSRLLVSAQSHGLGSTSARVQIIEFADFQCPPCRHVAPDLRKLVSKYSGTVRLVQREFPNVKRHPQAERAAEIAECFGDQGKYWEAAAELYRAASVPDDTELGSWATRLGADTPQLMACMSQRRGLAAVVQDRQDGRALGVSVTPTLFIGSTVLEGPASFDKLEGLLHSEMAGHPRTVESASESLTPASGGCVVQSEEDSANLKKDTDTHCH
jgi:protein-disulfide isomerase